jgi:hypothetical protein
MHRQGVTWPHLRCEAHAEIRQPAIAHEVGDGFPGQAHRQHAVPEDSGIPGDLLRVHLVGV